MDETDTYLVSINCHPDHDNLYVGFSVSRFKDHSYFSQKQMRIIREKSGSDGWERSFFETITVPRSDLKKALKAVEDTMQALKDKNLFGKPWDPKRNQ